MRHFYPFLFLLVILLLFVTGCNVSGRAQLAPDPVDFGEVIPSPTSTESTFPASDIPAVTPKSSELDGISDIQEGFVCDERFCMIEWPGWVERPFLEPDRDWIDLTYPYASTGNGNLAIHHGVEFPNPYGTPVHAAADGIVVYAGIDENQIFGPFANFYGMLVIIEHENVYDGGVLFSLYGHLSSILVNSGDEIQTGDILGKVGVSGVADGSHLHFEIRYAFDDYHHSTNPILWFSPYRTLDSEKTSTLAGFISDSDGHPVSEASLTLERLIENGETDKHYYFKSYAQNGVNAHPLLGENFAMPDLPPGDYRLSFVSGTLYEVFFTLEPGMLGFVNLITK